MNRGRTLAAVCVVATLCVIFNCGAGFAQSAQLQGLIIGRSGAMPSMCETSWSSRVAFR